LVSRQFPEENVMMSVTNENHVKQTRVGHGTPVFGVRFAWSARNSVRHGADKISDTVSGGF